MPVFQKFFQNFFQGKNLRLDPVYQRNHVEIEILFKIGVLVEIVQNFLRMGVSLQVYDYAQAVFIGFIAQVFDSIQFFFMHQVGDGFQHLGFVDLIGYLRDYDLY